MAQQEIDAMLLKYGFFPGDTREPAAESLPPTIAQPQSSGEHAHLSTSAAKHSPWSAAVSSLHYYLARGLAVFAGSVMARANMLPMPHFTSASQPPCSSLQ
jgi:hypothetical protein